MEQITVERPNSSGDLVRLLAAIAAEEVPALRQLYQRTSGKLFGICLRMVKSEAEAEDVLQEVYLQVWRNAARYDPTKASPITWLALLARNKSIDCLRRQSAPSAGLDQAMELADGAPSVLELITGAQEAGRLSACLDKLEPHSQVMIRAAFMDGLTYSQLAESEVVPLSTVKSRIRRALHRLRGCLEQ